MRHTKANVLGFVSVTTLCALVGCSSQKQAAAPLLSHAEIAAAHRTEMGNDMAFAVGDTHGASMVRDAASESIETPTFVLLTDHGFLAGDALGAMGLRSLNVRTVAGVRDE